MGVAHSDTVTSTSCVSDVLTMNGNGFADINNTLYLAYINLSGHAVLTASTDLGATWTQQNDFGAHTGVSVNGSQTGDVVVTCWDSQVYVYVNGTQVAIGSVGANYPVLHAACIYPLLLISANTDAAYCFCVKVDTNPTFGPDQPQTFTHQGIPGMAAGVLGYSTDGKSACIVTYTASRSGGYAAYTNAAYVPLDGTTMVTVPAQNYAGGYATDYASDCGVVNESVGHCYSGFRSFTDFEGVTAGYSLFEQGPGLESMAARYSPGLAHRAADAFNAATNTWPSGQYSSGYWALGPSYRVDRGLQGIHTAAVTARVNGTLMFGFVDLNGMIGSTIPTIDLDPTDSQLNQAPYSRSRAYGTLPGLKTPLLWTIPNQANQFVMFALTSAISTTTGATTIAPNVARLQVSSGQPMQVTAIRDTDPFQNRRGGNVTLRSQLTTVTTAPAATTTLGVVRSTGSASDYNLAAMRAYLTSGTHDVLPNPNQSPGCSPVLRALFVDSGLAFTVTRELFNDGDPNGHYGGNAVDIAGPDFVLGSDGGTPTAVNSAELSALTAFIAQVPQLFSAVIYTDPNGINSLYVWDGQVADTTAFGGPSARVVQAQTASIHVASSPQRLLAALNSPDTIAALGGTPTLGADGKTRGRARTDPFTQNNYVYVATDTAPGVVAPPLTANNPEQKAHDFW